MKRMFMLLSVLVMIGSLRPASAANRSAALPAGDDAKIVRVVNADTIEVTINKIGFTIGLIGLDAPNKGECYEPQATAYLRKLLRAQTLRVVRDQSDFDSAGRLMRYVYLADGQLLNETLIKLGYANYANVSPDQQQSTLFEKAQQAAQSAKAGLWKSCNVQSSNANTGKSSIKPNQSNCTVVNYFDILIPGPHQPVFDTLPLGSCITITLETSSGQYTWFPKDSKLKLPDEFIAYWDGQAVSVYKNEQGEYASDTLEIRPDPQRPQNKISVRSVQGLVYDGPYVRLQHGPNLFLHHGDNNMTALVGIAQYVTGTKLRFLMKRWM